MTTYTTDYTKLCTLVAKATPCIEAGRSTVADCICPTCAETRKLLRSYAGPVLIPTWLLEALADLADGQPIRVPDVDDDCFGAMFHRSATVTEHEPIEIDHDPFLRDR